MGHAGQANVFTLPGGRDRHQVKRAESRPQRAGERLDVDRRTLGRREAVEGGEDQAVG